MRKLWLIEIDGFGYREFGKTALEAVITVLNDLRLQYKDTKFKVSYLCEIEVD